MREILFKAKSENTDGTKDWVEGYLSKCEGEFIICDDEGIGVGIDPDTICQYTGLTDKNGNKIWENDVVCTPYVDPVFGDMVNDKILDDYAWKVVFIDGGFCVDNKYKLINLRSFTNGNHIKVIGNIFDNPELLRED